MMPESSPRLASTSPTSHRNSIWAAIVLIAGVLLATVGGASLLSGIAAATLRAQQVNDGFLRSSPTELSTAGFALTSSPFDIDGDLAEFPARWLTVEARVASARGGPGVFVGIGPRQQVAAYLEDVAYSEVTQLHTSPGAAEYHNFAGDQSPTDPEDERFWVVADAGSHSARIETALRSGEWVVVVMNRDGSHNVHVKAQLGARTDALLPVAIGALLVGILLIVLGGILVVLGAYILGRTGVAGSAPPAGATPNTPVTHQGDNYPARLVGRLSPSLSRALWLVKWLLLIPHYLILAILWFAFVCVTIVAWFAILFTGRYPRPLFDFSVGVLRWTWRVAFYGYSALATDQYPPFTLARTSYPADFEVDYPERWSRGLVLVSWLLAAPQLVVVALLVVLASWNISANGEYVRVGLPTLLGFLTLVAAVVLLFTGQYKPPLFDLLMGINRWVYRVLVYVFLLRDEYPPFRLDQGADEPSDGAVPRGDSHSPGDLRPYGATGAAPKVNP